MTFVDNGDGTATLSGTASVGGVYRATFMAANGVGASARQLFTLMVRLAPTIASAPSVTFAPGTARSFTVATTGFPAPTLTQSGALPAGITFVDNGNGTGVLQGTAAAGTGGTYALQFTATNSLASVVQNFTLNIRDITIPSNGAPLVMGSGPGSTAVVRVISATTDRTLAAYVPAFLGGVQVTLGDIDGDGTVDIVTAAGPGGGPHVRVLSGVDFHDLFSFYAFEPSFSGGVNVALGDIDGDGTPDIIAGSGPGGNGHVRVFSGKDLHELASFLAYAPSFAGGVFVAAGDIDGDGRADIITGAGAEVGGSPHVRVFSGVDLHELASFYAYAPIFSGGVRVAAGDVDGDGHSDIITGAGVGGGPHVRVFSGADLHELASFYAYAPAFTGGISVAAGDIDGDGHADIITGAGPGGGPEVHVFSGVDVHNAFMAFGLSSAVDIHTIATFQAFSTGSGVSVGSIGDQAILGFTSQGSTSFQAGTAGTFTITAVGVPAPALSFSGTLPAGVSFTDNGGGTATLAGTPAANSGGTYPLTLTAANGVHTATQTFTLTVNQAPAVTSAATATFSIGAPGTFAVTSTGFPRPTLTQSGALAAGVTWVDNGDGTGTLSGTPAAGTGGTHSFTLTATNGIGAPATQSFTLSVNGAGSFTSANNAAFTVGAAGAFSITTSSFPAATTIARGGVALPTGVTFTDNHDGTATLAGTPAAGTGGTYAITFTFNNGVAGNIVQNFTLTVLEPPLFTSANSTTFAPNAAGSFLVTLSGFPAPTVTVTGALPSGVTFTPGTRLFAGTPTQTGSFPLVFTASNGVGSPVTQNFTLSVNGAPSITSANTAMFLLNTAGTFQVVMTGSPAPTVTVTTGVLPTGLTLSSAGLLSGTPTQSGSFPVTLTATNGTLPDATQSFTVVVNTPPAITSANAATFALEHGRDVPGGDDRFPGANGQRDRGRAAQRWSRSRRPGCCRDADAERILCRNADRHQRHAAGRDAELHGPGRCAAGNHERQRGNVRVEHRRARRSRW